MRLGFLYGEARDKRARRAKLIGALRVFAHSDSRSRVTVWAHPQVNDEDAHAALAAAFTRRFASFDLNAETKDEAEVTPPPEAGEHSRAHVVATTGRRGDSRGLSVVWVDQGPMFMGVSCSAPSGEDIWDLVSALVKRQRECVAHGSREEAAIALGPTGGRGDAANLTARAWLRRRRLRTLMRIAVPVVVAAALFTSQTASGPPASGGFAGAPMIGSSAGYQQLDPDVSQVSATITVPRISAGAAYSDASTWIGAHVRGPNYGHLPAVQVGIIEAEQDYRPPTDEAFWSDTAHHFMPVRLFPVKPGDRVVVSLIQARHHWIITATDGTSRRQVVTTQEAGATFGVAAWLQEDPDVGSHFYVYPKIADVHISKLSVNGRPPAQSTLYPDWLSMHRNVVAFKPTGLAHDAFTVVPIASPR